MVTFPTVTPPSFPGIIDDTPSSTTSKTSTVPSAVVFNFINGTSPGAEKLAALGKFAQTQFDSYKASGVARPEVGPYEALGRAFAEEAAFAAKYGKLTNGEFVWEAYNDVFGRRYSNEQGSHFQGQVDYFVKLYKGAGIADATALQLAKGAVLGQMLAFAVLDEGGKHPNLDKVVSSVPSTSLDIGLAGQAQETAASDFL